MDTVNINITKHAGEGWRCRATGATTIDKRGLSSLTVAMTMAARIATAWDIAHVNICDVETCRHCGADIDDGDPCCSQRAADLDAWTLTDAEEAELPCLADIGFPPANADGSAATRQILADGAPNTERLFRVGGGR